MLVLGRNLPDRQLVSIALTAIRGISHPTAQQICNRLQFHDRLTIGQLTETQMNSLAALLTSPSTAAPLLPGAEEYVAQRKADPLASLVLEADLRRQTRQDIAHHKSIGNYRGRRHQAGYPVRGQNTQNNARTARRLNKYMSAGYCTSARSFPSDGLLEKRSQTDRLQHYGAASRPSVGTPGRSAWGVMGSWFGFGGGFAERSPHRT